MQASHPANFRIVVEGVLDPMWLQCLGGFDLAEERSPEQRQPGQPVITRLEGRPADESALQGVLDTLFMLGMRLILVERVPPTRCGGEYDPERGETHQGNGT